MEELGGLFGFLFLIFKVLLPIIVFFYLLRMAGVIKTELKVEMYSKKVYLL